MRAKLKALNQKTKPTRKIHPTRWSEEEWAELKRRADLYAGGNVSAYLRYVALNYKPKKSELEI